MDSQDLAPTSFAASQTIVPFKRVRFMREDETAHFMPGEARRA